MWYVIVFLIGAASGIAALFLIAAVMNPKLVTEQAFQLSADAKLRTARKYLGMIANRESIMEARKIANKAIKETE